MSTLHTIYKAWQSDAWLFEALAFAQKNDAILLYQDAVLALQSPLTLASFVAKCQALNIKVYALLDDCQLRGIECKLIGVELIDYTGFVSLAVQHDKQCAW